MVSKGIQKTREMMIRMGIQKKRDMRKRISLIMVFALIIALSTQHALSYSGAQGAGGALLQEAQGTGGALLQETQGTGDALLQETQGTNGSLPALELKLKTGDILNINRQTNEMYFMTLAGSEIETNIYNVSGGQGINGQGANAVAFCLEHGSSYPPSNAPMVAKEAYFWIDTPKGRSLTYDPKTHQPLAHEKGITLRNGYKVTQADLYALDSIIQKVYSDTRLTHEQRLYAAQNAIRAYMSAVANVFWASGKIEFSPGYFDGSGRLTVGSVKAKNIASNEVMKLAEEYYNLMLRSKAAGAVISDGYIRHNTYAHATNNGETTVYQFQITSSDPWRVDADSYTKLSDLGAQISPTSGESGTVITVIIPNSKIVEASQIGLSLRTQVLRGSGGLLFLEPQDKRLQSMIFAAAVKVDDKQGIIRFGPAPELDDDYPLPEIPRIIVPGLKSDLEGGFDNNRQSGRGDAKLNAGFEVYINGEYQTTFYADENGQNGSSEPFEIWQLADLTPTITIHTEAEVPQRVEWRGVATVTVREIVPEGYFSEELSNTGTGFRTYTVTYYAVTGRNIRWISGSDDDTGYWEIGPWDEYRYMISPDTGYNYSTSDRTQQPVRFTNLVQKGNLHINKTIEKDFDPWGSIPASKEPMKGAKFTISLVTAGSEGQPYLRAEKIKAGEDGYDPLANSYRVVKDGSGIYMDGNSGEDSYFVTSEFGYIRIYDIPWGNYQLNEISASEAGYVLENTNFNITYDGQNQLKNITNYVIKDEIVIHKVDAETGKRIPSDKMAFRIRYMGNPNTPKDQRPNDPNYGKYLTHQLGASGAVGYTFYTDANGKCQFPYPLSYGVYQIEEFVAPDGYYLGEIENGVLPYVIHEFTVDKMGANPFEHPVIVIETKNNAVKGQIEIHKTGETIVGFRQQHTEYGILNVPIFAQKPKDGVSFDIYAKSDIKLPDGIDAPLFRTRNGEIIELETKAEDHALWKNATRVEEKIMADGTELSVVTQRYPNDLTAMATANLLTAIKRPNMYSLNYQGKYGGSELDQTSDLEFHLDFDYEIATEYTPDGYVIADINLVKLSEYTQGTIYDTTKFPTHEAVWIESGENLINDISQYRNDIFQDGNEVSMKYSVEYYLAAEFEEIKPIEHVYVLEDSELGNQLIQTFEIYDEETGELVEEIVTVFEPEGFVYLESFAPQFVYIHDADNCDEKQKGESTTSDGEKEDMCEHAAYLVAVDVAGQLKFVECNFDGRAWTNLPSTLEFAKLTDYTLLYHRLLEENRIMYEKNAETPEIPRYLIYGVYEGVPSVIGCTESGEFYDTRKEVFDISLYKVPKTQNEIRLRYADFDIELCEINNSAIVNITIPESVEHSIFNLDGTTQKTEKGKNITLAIQKTLPSVIMQLNDGTTVGVVYSGGFAFATIEVPLGNEYPILTYDGVNKSLTLNEQGVLLDPSNPFVELLAHDASGDRITAELIAPIGTEEKTIFTIATRRTDQGIIVFDFPDGRKMNVSILQDQNGSSRGLVSVTCLTPTYRYLLGEFVETVTTGKNNDTQGASNFGSAISSKLPLGSYVIREKGVSDALIVTDSDFEVTLTYQNNYIPLIWGSLSVENEMASIQINLKKVFQSGSGSSTYVPRAGAVFGVYTNDNGMLPQNSLVGILTTDKDGIATSAFKAPFGEYYIKELKTLAGYDLNPYIYPFSYNQETVTEPLKTEFTDKGVTVEYRYKGDYATDVVIRTLKRIPAILYSINGVTIDTTKEETKAVGQAIATSRLTSIDHITEVVSSKSGKSEITIDLGDENTIKLIPKEKGYKVELTYKTENPPVIKEPTANITNIVESVLDDGTAISEIEYKLGLNNIRYRATLESKYESKAKKPVMNIIQNVDSADSEAEVIKIYREIDINAGTDKLVIENAYLPDISTDIPFVTDILDETKHSIDINLLPSINYISFSREVDTGNNSACMPGTVKVEHNNGVLTLYDETQSAKITALGKEIERTGILADGSFVTNSPVPTIAYFNKNITINDVANSNEFIEAIIGGTYASGKVIFNNTPFWVYRDGVSVTPDKEMMLDKMIPYTVIMSDGETKADIVLLSDNTLIMNLDGKISSNFEAYTVPTLESQRSQDYVVDINGNKIEQKAALQLKTIDNMTYFVTESRTYSRADAYAPVTIIDINTADGVLQGIINNLRPGETPKYPEDPKPETPEKPEDPKPEIPEEPKDPEEPAENPEEETELTEYPEENVEPEEPKDVTPSIEPRKQSETPQTGAANNSVWWLLMLLSGLAFPASARKKTVLSPN